jgi:hypothetical protein
MMLGFTTFVSNNVLVYSGKETVLEISMEEDIYALKEVTVTAKVDKELPLNRMAVVSARMLSSEEANRYAGTFAGDPARMVAGFAGVTASNDRQYGTTTNEKGEFSMNGIPVGRCNISVSMLGFTTFVSNNVLVYSGKETVLEIAMEEDIFALEEVTVTAKVDKEQPLNKMAVVSARMLSSEEANRYAGTFAGDPARMVAGFAGVTASNDTRNDIIIRGNSPAGVLWRLDGFDIPNPNHFGAMGAAGGPISMLNYNQLTNSDFYTGAFPAEFGNATSGVFDLRLRNGNNQKHEFMGSAGLLGLELGAEGPLSKTTGASYLINGRYAFFGILDAMGIAVDPDHGDVPEYHDVCAKINIPLKSGNLSWVTLFGASKIHHNLADFSNPSEWTEGDRGTDETESYGQMFTGLNYTHRFNASTRLENRLSYQWMRDAFHRDDIEFPSEKVFHDVETQEYREGRIVYGATLHHRVSAKSSIKSGIGADVYLTDLRRTEKEDGEIRIPYNYNKNSELLKAFFQWQYRLGASFSIVPGVYGHYYTLGGDYSIEPRIGFKWEASPMTSFSLGGGLHSQLQHRLVQMFIDETGKMVNKNLKMSKSWQTVAGYNQKIGTGMHLKTEIYYQWLFDIPVIPAVPEESYLNYAQDDQYDAGDMVFVNKGTGRNYGVEMTLEKFFDKHYYFLLTASLYDSKYKAIDNVERRTRFAGNYAFNALFGYEWKTGKRSLFSVNTKVAYIGGKREVPLNNVLVAEPDVYEWRFDYTQAYRKKLPAYFRLDLNVNMKTNYKRFSLEWFIEVVNLTNHGNIRARYYDSHRDEFYYDHQYGLLPVFGCRIYF